MEFRDIGIDQRFLVRSLDSLVPMGPNLHRQILELLEEKNRIILDQETFSSLGDSIKGNSNEKWLLAKINAGKFFRAETLSKAEIKELKVPGQLSVISSITSLSSKVNPSNLCNFSGFGKEELSQDTLRHLERSFLQTIRREGDEHVEKLISDTVSEPVILEDAPYGAGLKGKTTWFGLLAPYRHVSREICIIDPYLVKIELKKLEKLIAAICSIPERCTVKILTENPERLEVSKKQLKEKLASYDFPFSIEYRLLKSKKSDVHDRFMMTNLLLIEVGPGFDLFEEIEVNGFIKQRSRRFAQLNIMSQLKDTGKKCSNYKRFFEHIWKERSEKFFSN